MLPGLHAEPSQDGRARSPVASASPEGPDIGLSRGLKLSLIRALVLGLSGMVAAPFWLLVCAAVIGAEAGAWTFILACVVGGAAGIATSALFAKH